jgi:diguanylate cyclase (GGDEF)-like protein
VRDKISQNPNFSIQLILAAALGSSVFTIAAGIMVYRSTSNLIAAARWVQHTQEVLTSLQTASQFVDRIESNGRLYLSTRDEEQLNAVRAAVLRLQASTLHLRVQTVDNPTQSGNLAALEDCSSGLSKDVDTLTATKAVPTLQLFRCRQAINQMSEEERNLLRERTEASQSGASVSLTTDIAFVGLSLTFLFVLFGFLLRDALARRRTAAQTTKTNQELAASVKALEERAGESQLLTTVRDELQLCVKLEQVYECGARTIGQLLPGSLGSLGMIDNSRHTVEAVAHWGDPSATNPIPEIFTPASCCGLRSGSLRWRHAGFSQIHCTHFRGDVTPPDSYLCIPMSAHGETIGMLFVQATPESTPEIIAARLDGLRQIIQLIAMSVASLQLRLKLEHQSIRDPLTGLFNRHFMTIALQKEIARAKRKHHTLGVLMLDVDHFKTFNDQFGHAAGDIVLKSVAAALQTSVRTEDIVCRYGGEEFIIVLPEIDPGFALQLAERIREAVSRLGYRDGAIGRGVTLSIGIAFYPDDGTEANDIIAKADQALYRAKNEGRDRVVFFNGAMLELPQLS